METHPSKPFYKRSVFFACICLVMSLWILEAKEAGAALYEVGPGRAYARIVDVPTHELLAGDIVRVYYKSTPYREKFLLHGVGTAAAPIVLQGVPDANGNKPVIDGANAVSNESAGNHYWNEERQVVLVGQYDSRLSDYIIIDGFIIRNANRNNSFTNDVGNSQTYLGNAAGIRISYANHVTIRNCEIYGNENGIFSGHTTDLTIEHSYVHDNGAGSVASSLEHNLYLGGGPGSRVTVQYSRFGELLNDGQQVKFRTETLIFRYNWIEGGRNSQMDLVEAGDNGTANAYVYGNVIIKPVDTHNGRMIHFGGDEPSVPRTGTLYFFNNTCLFNANTNGRLFQISEPGAQVIAQNNIFFNNSGNILQVWTGHPNIFGSNNWLSEDILDAEVFAANIVGSDPGFADIASQDFTLADTSPCVNVVSGFSPPAGHHLDQQYVKHLNFEPRINDGLLDLGAFENTSPPPILYPLTVMKAGAGIGSIESSPPGITCGTTCSADYEEDTVVTLTAAAVPGSIFNGWSGEGCSGTENCVVTMDSAKTVTALFVIDDGEISFLKSQAFDVDRGGDPGMPFVYRGDTISYSITATNSFQSAVELMISDSLSALLDFVGGTLEIDGQTVSDSYFTDDLLQYQSGALGYGDSLTISFKAVVINDAPFDEIIRNVASITANFVGLLDPIFSDRESNPVQAQVKNPIPEPSTFLFLSVGLAGIFALTRRKRRKKK